MKTDNELIAEFMGAKYWPKCKWWQFPKYSEAYEFPDVPVGFAKRHLRYDTSWVWIMPVVEKITKLYEEAFPSGEKFIEMILAHEHPIDKEYMDVVALPISTSHEEVYQAVVKFIKWHNEQNKQS